MPTGTIDRIGGGAVIRRLATGLAVAAVALTSALALASPAAAQEPKDAAPGTVLVLPSAPADTGASSLAAASPTISPAAARVRYFAPGSTASCPSGNLCLAVWNSPGSNWKVFDLYYCHRYALSNWYGQGHWVNNQTGGATAYAY
ncbi:hypothetical protein O7608_11130 [Solwaraspora sp. WMMA2056]|nr:hypothetical protein [Solwaraspora sp. WMMA2056]WJK42887.1 hypothetical protein O7608_11130 [Solwaraspora sp. WMMA2056]